MPKLKNISPLGALDVPLLRTVVAADQVIDVTEAQAKVLLLQPGNYAPADKATRALADTLTPPQDPDAADGRAGHDQDAQAPASGADTEGDSK